MKRNRPQKPNVETARISSNFVKKSDTPSWDTLIGSLDKFSSDFMEDRQQPCLENRKADGSEIR